MSDSSPSPTPDRPPDNPSVSDSAGPPTPDALCDRLETVIDPVLGGDVVSLGLVDDVRVDDEVIVVRMGLYAPYAPAERRLVADVHEALSGYGREVVTVAGHHDRDGDESGRLPGVRNVVPFVGVGDATDPAAVATNVAFALSRTGARVGVLDLDDSVFETGHGSSTRVESSHGDAPATVQGVSLVSSRFGSGPAGRSGTPSPEPDATIDRLTAGVDWGGVDYLFVGVDTDRSDLEDALFDRVSTAGAVVAAARQTSIAAVRRRFGGLKRRGTTPLGLIENVTGSVRGELRRRFDVTPSRWVDEESDVPVLGTIPDDPTLATDHGTAVIGENGSLSPVFDAVASNVADAVGGAERRVHARHSDGVDPECCRI